VARIGAELKLARSVHGMSIQAAADRAGVSWSTAVRLELGDANATVATLTAMAEAVGLDLVLRAYPGRAPSLRDTGQLELAKRLLAQLHPSIKPTVELPIGPQGESVDLALFGVDEIVCVEIERRIVDFQEQYRRAARKREAIAAMHRRKVRLVLAIEDTRRNRAALDPHLDVARTALPAGSRRLLRQLAKGEVIGSDGLLWIRRDRRALDGSSSVPTKVRPRAVSAT
jgi:transcriptional regulator with XRE-family HTH domain